MMIVLNKEQILEQAKSFIDEGRYDKAIREYEKVILADPADLRVKLRIAELHVKRKQLNDAIRVFREVAQSYTGEGFYLKAVTVYKNILKINPSLIEINEQLGELYERMGVSIDAVRQYELVANALERRGDVEHVVEVRSKIVHLDPDNAFARVRLAELYQRTDRQEEALDQYEALVHSLEKQTGTENKRIDLYEKILPHRMDRHEMLRELIQIYYREKEHRKALKWLEAASDLTPYDTELLSMQANVYRILNQFESSQLKYRALAELHLEQGNIDGALEAYGWILFMNPEDEEWVSQEIELLRPGGVPTVKAWVARQQQELEVEEERRRQEESERAREVEARKTAEQKTQAEQEREERKRRIEHVRQKTGKLGKEATPSAPPPPPPPLPSKSLPPPLMPPPSEIAEADAAYTLAKTYQKMGLNDEAQEEREKARKLYQKLAESGSQEPRIVERLRELNGAPHAPLSPEKKTTPKTAPKPEPETKRVKKKISFV